MIQYILEAIKTAGQTGQREGLGMSSDFEMGMVWEWSGNEIIAHRFRDVLVLCEQVSLDQAF